MNFKKFWAVAGLGFACFVAAGCGKKAAQVASSGLPSIPVAKPIQAPVTEFAEYTGRMDAIETVGIKARVTGYLKEKWFKEGQEVTEGQLLFVVEPAPYEALVKQAQSQVDFNLASIEIAKTQLALDRALNKTDAVSKLAVLKDEAVLKEAEAQMAIAQASLDAYNLNLSYTRVKSPIRGIISRTYYTQGNLIGQDQTLMTTVVHVGKMYLYFDMDERTALKIRDKMRDDVSQAVGAIAGAPALSINSSRHWDIIGAKVQIGLDNEEGSYPHEGIIDFTNNAVNPATGTISVRGVFDNPIVATPRNASPFGQDASPHKKDEAGQPKKAVQNPELDKNNKPDSGKKKDVEHDKNYDPEAVQTGRLMSPGNFVRVKLPIGQQQPALLVIDRAISSDQGLKYVYVLGKDNQVKYRTVTTGALQENGLRVIETGLSPDDWVIVGGLQQIHAGVEINAVKEEMPIPGKDNLAESTQHAMPPPSGAKLPQPAAGNGAVPVKPQQ